MIKNFNEQLTVMNDNLIDSIKYNVFLDYDQLDNCQYQFMPCPDISNMIIDTWRLKYDKMKVIDLPNGTFQKALDMFPIFIDETYKVTYNVWRNSRHPFSLGVPYYLRKVSVVSNKKDDKHAEGKLKERAFVTLRTPTTQIRMPMYKYKKLKGEIYDPYYPTIFNECSIGDVNPNEYFEELKRWFIIVRRCYDKSYWHYPFFGKNGMRMVTKTDYNIDGKVNNFGSMKIFKNYLKLTKYARAHNIIPYTKPTEENPGGYGYIEPNDYNMYCHKRYALTDEDKLMLTRFPTETQTNLTFAQNARQLMLPFDQRINYVPKKAGRPKGSTNRVHKMITVKHEARDPWDVWADKY